MIDFIQQQNCGIYRVEVIPGSKAYEELAPRQETNLRCLLDEYDRALMNVQGEIPSDKQRKDIFSARTEINDYIRKNGGEDNSRRSLRIIETFAKILTIKNLEEDILNGEIEFFEQPYASQLEEVGIVVSKRKYDSIAA